MHFSFPVSLMTVNHNIRLPKYKWYNKTYVTASAAHLLSGGKSGATCSRWWAWHSGQPSTPPSQPCESQVQSLWSGADPPTVRQQQAQVRPSPLLPKWLRTHSTRVAPSRTHFSWVRFRHFGLTVFWPLWHSAGRPVSWGILFGWQFFTSINNEYLLGWQSGRNRWRSTSSP